MSKLALGTRAGASFLRILEFMISALILGIFSYYLAGQYHIPKPFPHLLIASQSSPDEPAIPRSPSGKKRSREYQGLQSSTPHSPSSSLSSSEASPSSPSSGLSSISSSAVASLPLPSSLKAARTAAAVSTTRPLGLVSAFPANWRG
jgi:hypothetical protein